MENYINRGTLDIKRDFFEGSIREKVNKDKQIERRKFRQTFLRNNAWGTTMILENLQKNDSKRDCKSPTESHWRSTEPSLLQLQGKQPDAV